MPATLTDKILARACGRPVRTGMIIDVKPDIILTHDHQGPMTIREFRNIGAGRLHNPDSIYMFMDHRTPSQTDVAASNHKIMREFCREQEITHLFDVGRGICHDVLIEQRAARPGQVVVGTDSHTVTIGALGVFGTGVGSSEMAAIWARGFTWFRVPECIRVILEGTLPPHVCGKDVAFALLKVLGTDGATYKSMEFYGEGAASLPLDYRLTICNMCLEMGAKSALFPVDDVTRNYYAAAGISDLEVLIPDEGAEYAQEIRIDLSMLEPCVAAPDSPANVVEARLVAPQKIAIDEALIGTCTNGRISDLREAAEVLKGRMVHPGVRMLIVPATRDVYCQALDEGLISIFARAGAMVGVPCCGPCGGYGMGVLAAGETCITTGSRNFVARLGSPEGHIYLGGPATVAASAVAGYVTAASW